MKKQVKIVGLSINSKIGGLEAVDLKFDPKNKLTIIKGGVGSGKTTLNKTLSATTKGTKTFEDKGLYGDFDATAQLIDGDNKVFVNTKSDLKGSLVSTIYTIDANGNKLKDVVIDGKKLTPSNYLSSLQTALTWRLDELTNENPTVQKKLLLELYSSELEKKGVIFDKNHPNYVDGVIDKIEKAKNKRSLMNMRREEVGGIADHLKQKGIPYEERRELKPISLIDTKIAELNAKKILSSTNLTETRESSLKTLEIEIGKIKESIRLRNDRIKTINKRIDDNVKIYHIRKEERLRNLEDIKKSFYFLGVDEVHFNELLNIISSKTKPLHEPTRSKISEVQYNEKGQIVSKANDFSGYLNTLLRAYYTQATDYVHLRDKPIEEVDTTEIDSKLLVAHREKESLEIWNKEAEAINSLQNWIDSDRIVKDLQKDYYLKLVGIETGVDGLSIAPEYNLDKEGNKLAKGNDIYLMYDGSYDTDYFHNPNKELRKLSAYSDTQKPMICLLIQSYLINKKGKSLPYLWIDKVPIDNKTRDLIEKMSEDLGLWLFVSWTGDFEKSNLKDGEMLIENGEIFFNK